jgi:hypothetical protein
MMAKLKRAWLITWVGSNTHNDPPVAILNPNRGSASIRDMVELLYSTHYYSPAQKLAFAKSPSQNPHRATVGEFQRITCGHNPCLFARIVTNIGLNDDDDLEWTEPPPVDVLREDLIKLGLMRT